MSYGNYLKEHVHKKKKKKKEEKSVHYSIWK